MCWIRLPCFILKTWCVLILLYAGMRWIWSPSCIGTLLALIVDINPLFMCYTCFGCLVGKKDLNMLKSKVSELTIGRKVKRKQFGLPMHNHKATNSNKWRKGNKGSKYFFYCTGSFTGSHSLANAACVVCFSYYTHNIWHCNSKNLWNRQKAYVSWNKSRWLINSDKKELCTD